MYLVSHILLTNQTLVCHVPEVALDMAPLKDKAINPVMIELNWKPGTYDNKSVIICSVEADSESVQFIFQASHWDDLSKHYESMQFLWGSDLLDEENSLLLPTESWHFYQFLTNCFEDYRKSNLPHHKKATLQQIVTAFFPIEGTAYIETVH